MAKRSERAQEEMKKMMKDDDDEECDPNKKLASHLKGSDSDEESAPKIKAWKDMSKEEQEAFLEKNR